MRRMVLGLVACSWACTRAPTETHLAPRSERSAVTAQPQHGAVTLGQLRSRFGFDLPELQLAARRRCLDETLADAARAPVPVRLRDARSDRRQLIPLRLITTLTSESALEIAETLRASEQDSVAVPERVARLAETRYLAELAVETYQAPRLFRRKNEPRSQWSPAVLSGRLVIYDLSEARPLCDAPIDVRVSGEGQPIRRSLRNLTRERMTAELERAARVALERALRVANGRFRLEPWSTDARSQLLAELSR
jgi:hypothetical protein